MSKNQKSKPKENSPSSLISLNRNQIQNLNQRNRIGFLLCKPDNKSEEGINIKQKTATTSFNRTATLGLKTEQIFRVMESTARILDNRRNKLDDICPKMSFNSSEWIIESMSLYDIQPNRFTYHYDSNSRYT